MAVPVIDYAGLVPAERSAIESLVGGHTTLDRLLRSLGPTAIAEIITQDEYTHDVLVPREALWLNYDAT